MKILLLLAILCGSLKAWEDHQSLTRRILDPLRLPAAPVSYAPLKARGLREKLKINKKYVFPQKLGERPGSAVSPTEILAVYVDEPDWGCDQNLFEPDQYPELWTRDTPFVAGRTGLKSQGFRHLYFPGRFLWSEPIASLQIPMRPLGEAPSRAALFFDLSGDYFRRGQPYWGWRFLAWSMHYVEDLFQPFHTRQTPSKAFIIWKWKGWLPSPDIPRTAEQLSYYHLGFERWVTWRAHDVGSALPTALAGGGIAPVPSQGWKSFLTNEVVDFSGSYASQVGAFTRAIFPVVPLDSDGAGERAVEDPRWRSEVEKNASVPRLVRSVGEIFRRMGSVVRCLIQERTSSGR